MEMQETTYDAAEKIDSLLDDDDGALLAAEVGGDEAVQLFVRVDHHCAELEHRERFAIHPDAFGHSAWRETLGLARAAGARRVVVTHHAPEDTDRSLTRREAEVQNVFPGARFGRDGMIFSWRGASESPEPV